MRVQLSLGHIIEFFIFFLRNLMYSSTYIAAYSLFYELIFPSSLNRNYKSFYIFSSFRITHINSSWLRLAACGLWALFGLLCCYGCLYKQLSFNLDLWKINLSDLTNLTIVCRRDTLFTCGWSLPPLKQRISNLLLSMRYSIFSVAFSYISFTGTSNLCSMFSINPIIFTFIFVYILKWLTMGI